MDAGAQTPPPARVYPAWLEWWWIEQACRQRGVSADKAEAVLPSFAAGAQELSDLFTVARPEEETPVAKTGPSAKLVRPAKPAVVVRKKFPDYAADADLALAYGLYFFPPCFVRARLPLAEAIEFRDWRPAAKKVRVLDLGAGTGATGLAAAMFLRERGLADEVELTAVDHSPDSLARLSTLVRENAAHLPGLTLHAVVREARDWVQRELPRADDPFDLITLGFSLNEMLPAAQGLAAREDFSRRLARRLNEDGLLLFIEPALRETAEPLQELSDVLCAKPAPQKGVPRRENSGPPLPRWGPYAGDHACPLRAEGKFWNHEVREWAPPGSVALLNRQLWRKVDELKFSYALHGKKTPPTLSGVFGEILQSGDGLVARLVSPFYRGKGVFVAAAVGADGVKYTLDLPLRGLSREEIARHEAIERGDFLALRGLQQLGGVHAFRLPTPAALVARYHVD